MHAVAAPLQGTVVSIDVRVGDVVQPGQQVAVLESMKMEHVVTAAAPGVVSHVAAEVGATVKPGEPLVVIEVSEDQTVAPVLAGAGSMDLASVRPDLAEVVERHEITRDHRR